MVIANPQVQRHRTGFIHGAEPYFWREKAIPGRDGPPAPCRRACCGRACRYAAGLLGAPELVMHPSGVRGGMSWSLMRWRPRAAERVREAIDRSPDLGSARKDCPIAPERVGRSSPVACCNRQPPPRHSRPDAPCVRRTGNSGRAPMGVASMPAVSSANMAATCRLVVPWMRVSAQRSSHRSR